MSAYGYGYGMGASAYAADQPAGQLQAAATNMRRQGQALISAANSSGMVRVSGTTVSFTVPRETQGAMAMFNQAQQGINLLSQADAAEAEARRIAARQTKAAAPAPTTTAKAARPTPSAPQPVTGPSPSVSSPTAYTGPTYQPGRISAAVAASRGPARESILSQPGLPALSIQSPQVSLPIRQPVSRRKIILVLGGTALVGLVAYFLISRSR